jgi:hypothetical protein
MPRAGPAGTYCRDMAQTSHGMPAAPATARKAASWEARRAQAKHAQQHPVAGGHRRAAAARACRRPSSGCRPRAKGASRCRSACSPLPRAAMMWLRSPRAAALRPQARGLDAHDNAMHIARIKLVARQRVNKCPKPPVSRSSKAQHGSAYSQARAWL